jgi:hypothetical protein
VDGSVGGDLTAFGDRIELNGRIDGDVQLAGGRLRLGPGARIGGRVTYRSGDELVVEPGAQVAGGVRQSADERAWRRFAHGATIVGGITLSLGILLLGALLILAMPRFTREAADSIRRLPWQTIGIGDLGNELGMGSLPHALVVENILRDSELWCRVACDYPNDHDARDA